MKINMRKTIFIFLLTYSTSSMILYGMQQNTGDLNTRAEALRLRVKELKKKKTELQKNNAQLAKIAKHNAHTISELKNDIQHKPS